MENLIYFLNQYFSMGKLVAFGRGQYFRVYVVCHLPSWSVSTKRQQHIPPPSPPLVTIAIKNALRVLKYFLSDGISPIC